jgi:hypothetical protein
MDKKYYFISYRIDLGRSTPVFGQELIDMTPIEYVIYWKSIGGDYGERIILFAQEITEEEFKKNVDQINED